MEQPPVSPLPLDPLVARLPLGEPFTPAMAAAVGVGRSALDRLHREGRVRRLLRGVYVDAGVVPSPQLRARALRLVVGARHVVVGCTAAWLHGVEVPGRAAAGVPPVEVHGRRRRRGQVRLADRDLMTVEGLRCTTPLRTALDLGRRLGPDRALVALDGLLRTGTFSHTMLMAEVPRFGGQHGVVQLRELAALADARSAGPAESVLRLRWLSARLPTPTPALRVPGPRPLRLALGLDAHRFGAVLAGRVQEADRRALAARGWRVLVLGPERVLRAEPDLLIGHLEREFHLHLLAGVS